MVGHELRHAQPMTFMGHMEGLNVRQRMRRLEQKAEWMITGPWNQPCSLIEMPMTGTSDLMSLESSSESNAKLWTTSSYQLLIPPM